MTGVRTTVLRLCSGFSDERVSWTNLPQNSGSPSAPRNEGLRRARGSLIAYLGHDDLWFPWHLSELVGCFASGGVEFAYSLGALLAPEGVIGCFSLPRDFSAGDAYISPSNWMHRKSVVEKIGLWPEKIKFGDDREFVRRMMAARIPLEFRQHLSVLKYPAAAWRMYSLTSNYPQATQLEAIRGNPEALRRDLELQLASPAPANAAPRQAHLLPLPGVVRKLIRVALNWYGHDRWPVNRFEHWRWRRLTGLSQKKSK